MQGWWVADALNNPSLGPVFVVSWIVVVIASIVLHELAHGWMAIRLGDRTPIELGHMTWNPLVHMGGFSLIMFAVIGIAWGAMPINPSRLRGRYADAWVALAGPMMNLALAVLCMITLVLWVGVGGGAWTGSFVVQDPLYSNIATFLRLGALLNIVLMLFNLLPVIPLDGGRIAASISPAYARMFESENAAWVSIALFVLLFFFAFDIMFTVAAGIVDGVVMLAT